MTGKVLDNGSAGILILILPLAFAVIILYKLWPLVLLLILLGIGFKIWQDIQWQKWCEQINPYFNQLIKENQGYLTPVDLSLTANLSARAAKTFLSRKSEEYGVPPQKLEDKGMVYYFPTASALGSIFDDSDIIDESPDEPAINSYQIAGKDTGKLSLGEITQLAKEKQTQASQETEAATSAVAQLTKPEADNTSADDSSVTETSSDASGLSLIQAELAKRLDCNTSTVGRRKSDPDFAEWSQTKDPEGLAWKFIPETQLFVPTDLN